MAAVSSWLDKTLWPAVALLGAVLVYFQISDADIALQDHLYDFENRRWLVDRSAWWPTFLFHKLLKWLIIAFALSLLLRLPVLPRWKRPAWLPPVPPRDAFVVLLTLGLTPAIVSIGKASTNVFCPWDITRYGGKEEYVKTWTRYDDTNRPERCGNCWPAGHASGGCALVALATLATTRRGRIVGTVAGLLMGAVMGGYQMLKGAHYTSDTLVTLLLAWIIHLVLRRCLLQRDAAPVAPG